MKPDDFIAAVLPSAIISAQKTNIPAAFTVAQGALESAWGASMLAIQARNLFGVKADPSWHGDTYSINTREFLHGAWVTVPATWRKYPDWQGCIDDHAQFFLTNPRYKPAFDHTDAESFAHAIAAAGYATDPHYADKIISVIRSHKGLML